MLDKLSIKFLEYLVAMENMKMYQFYDFFKLNKHRKEADDYLNYLIKEGYIKLIDGNLIEPTFKASILFSKLQENKLRSLFVNFILPYIQWIITFMLGILVNFLLTNLK